MAASAAAMISFVQFGRDICGNLEAAESREWLVTNGIGGYASGTIAGSATRRYHGLLIAALQPPLGRTQLVAALDEAVTYNATDFRLATHHWSGGAVEPKGFSNIESFHLDDTTPVWTFALGDALLEKRIWMQKGQNITYVQYTLTRGSTSLDMQVKVLVNYRDFHASTHAGDWRMTIEPVENGARVLAFSDATPFYLKSAGTSCELHHDWCRDVFFPVERERGLDDRDDNLFAALFRTKLNAGSTLTLVLTTDPTAHLKAAHSLSQRTAYETELLKRSGESGPAWASGAPAWLQQLVLAADQFIVNRSLPDQSEGRTIIAGYHWFGDWGRDTMIALPGLTLATGQAEVARQILLAFARYVDGGMLPNNFPDAGGKPEYNTVDAALWYFEAVRQYYSATNDRETLEKLCPVLAGIVDAYVAGTRYKIHVDSADGLVYAGEPGVQLTWMDAKVGDWVVTPRIGKPVEISALWINALETMSKFAQVLNKPGDQYQRLSAQAQKGFQKFWNADRNCCYDVIDAPDIGNDASLRPNQIFAVSLPVSPLTTAQQQSVVDTCHQRLLTPYGLRSLAQNEPGYRGSYSGGPRDRDAAYHQGTVWGWLIGPFVMAHLRIYGDRAAAMRFLEPLGNSIQSYGLGTLGEIFDGDPPFTPRGCIAQAWTVGEVLRVVHEIRNRADSPPEALA